MTLLTTPAAGLNLHDAASAVGEAFERAAARTGTDVRHFRIAGHLVRTSFAGAALAQPLTNAFLHLTADSGEPELEIRVFDSRSTGEALPLGRATLEQLAAAAMPSVQATGGLNAAYRRPDSGLSFFDAKASTAWYWLPSLEELPGWERGGPFRAILSWWMPSHGKRFVHAGAVGASGKAALIAGPSGSGKSTTAISCFASGMDYLGDDYCLFSLSDGRVHSLHRSAKLHTEHLESARYLGPTFGTGTAGDDKGVFFPAPPGGGSAVASMPIGALVLPTVTGCPEPRLRQTTAADALAAVAPSTLLQLSAATAGALRDLALLCRQFPAYRLELGDRMDLVPGLIGDILS